MFAPVHGKRTRTLRLVSRRRGYESRVAQAPAEASLTSVRVCSSFFLLFLYAGPSISPLLNPHQKRNEGGGLAHSVADGPRSHLSMKRRKCDSMVVCMDS